MTMVKTTVAIAVHQKCLAIQPASYAAPDRGDTKKTSATTPSKTPPPPGASNQRGTKGGKSVSGTGAILNLMSVDARKISVFARASHNLWSAPLQLVLSLFLLWQELGPATLVGVLVIFVLTPITGALIRTQQKTYRKVLHLRDERTNQTAEYLGCIKIIKLYGWEGQFQHKIAQARKEELAMLRRLQITRMVLQSLFAIQPILITVAAFSFFTLVLGEDLDAARAFTSISLFRLLQPPLVQLPRAISSVIEARLSAGRVNQLMAANEIPPLKPVHSCHRFAQWGGAASNGTDGCAIVVEGATFYWNDRERGEDHSDADGTNGAEEMHNPIRGHGSTGSREPDAGKNGTRVSNGRNGEHNINGRRGMEDMEDMDAPRASLLRNGSSYATRRRRLLLIQDASFRVKKGELCVVHGSVGSGKSGLMDALIGDMPCESGGSVVIDGRIAFTAQVPWLQDRSVRDNILFGQPYDEADYQFVLQVFLTVLTFPTEIILTVFIFPTAIVLTVLIFLAEIVRTVLIYLLLKSFVLF
jgi:ABC-type multidrug transport system fused ATPase/permease subunit